MSVCACEFDENGNIVNMCPVHQKAVAEAYQAAFAASEALRTKPLRWRTMDWSYDSTADVLYISLGDPTPAISHEVNEGDLVRVNPDNGCLVGITIIDFGRRAKILDLAGRIGKLLRDIPAVLGSAGLRDGKATKPLRWRVGPVGEGELKEQHIIKNRNGNYKLVRGWTVQDWEQWLPLSDILDLIGGE